MSVVRESTCPVYHIRNDGEYATICVRDWKNEEYFGGEILINSSFGVFAHTWGSCSVPFPKFLTKVDYDYFMGKCIGDKSYVFDGPATYINIIKDIFLIRRNKYITKEQCRTAYLMLVDVQDRIIESDSSCVDTLWDIFNEISNEPSLDEVNEAIADAHEYIIDKKNQQAEAFWNELWPIFTNHIKKDLT